VWHLDSSGSNFALLLVILEEENIANYKLHQDFRSTCAEGDKGTREDSTRAALVNEP
jgi:hypothetical protein